MDFTTTPAQHRLLARIEALAPRLVDDDLEQRDRQGRFSRLLWSRLCEAGLHMLCAGPEFGGEDSQAQDLALAMGALGECCDDTGLVFSLAAHLCACVHPIARYGRPELRSHWLPRIARDQLLGAHAITEPEAGSDVSAMTTRAVRDGCHYRLSGRKCFISNAPVADFIVVHARTADSGSFFDFSAFVIDRSSPGLRIDDRPLDKVGLRTTEMGEVRLDDVRVHESHRLGDEGGGGPIFQACMARERTCLLALYLGTMKRQLGRCTDRLRNRQQFGKPLLDQQALAHRLVDMTVRYEAARLACLHAAWSLDNSQQGEFAAAIAKIVVSEAAVSNALDAVHLHGAEGILTGTVERDLRNALPSTLFSGGTELMKNQLARQLRMRARFADGQPETA